MKASYIEDLLNSPEALALTFEDWLQQEDGPMQLAEYVCWAYAAANGGHARLAAGQLRGLAYQAVLAQEKE